MEDKRHEQMGSGSDGPRGYGEPKSTASIGLPCCMSGATLIGSADRVTARWKPTEIARHQYPTKLAYRKHTGLWQKLALPVSCSTKPSGNSNPHRLLTICGSGCSEELVQSRSNETLNYLIDLLSLFLHQVLHT